MAELSLHQATEFVSASAEQAATAATEAQQAKAQAESILQQIRLELDKPTHKFHAWQQIPAWIVGVFSLYLGYSMVQTNTTSIPAWVFVGGCLIVAVVLSFRGITKFSVGGKDGGKEADDTA